MESREQLLLLEKVTFMDEFHACFKLKYAIVNCLFFNFLWMKCCLFYHTASELSIEFNSMNQPGPFESKILEHVKNMTIIVDARWIGKVGSFIISMI